MKHRGSFPHRSMDAPDRHNGQREASLSPSFRSFVRLLDGIWHYICTCSSVENSHAFCHVNIHANHINACLLSPSLVVLWHVTWLRCIRVDIVRSGTTGTARKCMAVRRDIITSALWHFLCFFFFSWQARGITDEQVAHCITQQHGTRVNTAPITAAAPIINT